MKNPMLVNFAGWSGSGKTTLIEKIIPRLVDRGYRVAVIKHDVHGVSADESDKDSGRLKKAGAFICIICGPGEYSYEESFKKAYKSIENADIIIVEGFKSLDLPKIVITRYANGKGVPKVLTNVQAIVCDYQIDVSVPVYNLDDAKALTEFILGNNIFKEYADNEQ